MAASRVARLRPLLAGITRPIRLTTTPRSRLLPRTQYISSTAKSARPDVFHSQLDDPAAASLLGSYKETPKAPQTLTEKIFQRHALDLAPGKVVRSGDFITLSPHRCMTHDNSWPVALKFMEMGATSLNNPNQIVMTLDHDVQNKSETNLKKYSQIEAFAKKQGVDFYPAGHGIGHQIMVEEGYAWPGSVAVASDSHSNMYGGVGCLGTPVVRTGAADIWATGATWFKIPPIAKVTFTGQLPKGATGKDVIVALCGIFNNDEVLNHAIEFVGAEDTMRSLPIDDRLTIANMTTEWGALSGLFPIDSLLQGYLRFRATEAAMYKGDTQKRFSHKALDALFADKLEADPNARYTKSLFLDLSTVAPVVSGPNSVKVATPVAELEAEKIKVDKAYLVSCTNSRASDIALAAKVFKDAAARGEEAKVAPGVKLYIAAASAAEQEQAEGEGDWQVLLDAGAEPLPSGCGPCIGLGTGLLEAGEVGISASNRNFKGRMGSKDAKAYLGSPEVVAASALKGIIAAPGWYETPTMYEGISAGEGDGIRRRVVGIEEALEKLIGQAETLVTESEAALSGSEQTSSASSAAEIVQGFPEKLEGEIIFCDADNINTDGIYPGKYTYQDNVSVEKMAEVCMENYDGAFNTLAKPGDILVSGFNFGTGSSREQAATAILAKKIPLVVAGSFGNIFATNSINNALMGLESPKLVQRLRETFSSQTSGTAQKNEAIKEPEANEQSLDSPPPAGPNVPAQEKQLTRRTGWKLTWDVRKSTIEVTEGGGGERWTEPVPEIPPNVQKIIAGGGLVKSRQAQFSG
ncbi:hypothetical protein FH972_024849 [Carpinus fangiana]|uniref:Homoaconitase, mitochondrial n=1 Tax=Carpinus fangiana TaxID=176857 RepID=A0A5N6L082_9ROSI|nr:hypothetical protein FH972_024849 [Carpinus fangiana]